MDLCKALPLGTAKKIISVFSWLCTYFDMSRNDYLELIGWIWYHYKDITDIIQ